MKTAEEIVAETDVAQSEPVEIDPFKDEYVQSLLSAVIEDDEVSHLEVALMELALWDLHINSDDVEKLEKSVRKSMLRSYSRAVAKTYFTMRQNGQDPDKVIEKYLRRPVAKAERGSRVITIPEYERTDGTIVEEHRRQLPGDMTRRSLDELKDIADEVKQASDSDYGRRQLRWGKGREILDRDPQAAQMIIDEWNKKLGRAREILQEAPKHMRDGEKVRVAESAAYEEKDKRERVDERNKKFAEMGSLLDDDRIKESGQRALKEETWGKRIVSVADYFNKTDQPGVSSTVKFAAHAIRDYGPITGMRIAHAYMRYGGYDVPLQRRDDGRQVTEQGDLVPVAISKEETRSWAIETLTSRLAREDTYDAGAKPPAEGFIIDGDGNVLAHAVGRGMDHYIPFNTRHLKKMRKTDRVEFVRSRMVGGPTVEDLHAAMMMGADKLTVVSNSGTYSVDFTKRSHGIKLEHFQVLSRYQEILDDYQDPGDGRKQLRKLDHDGYMRAIQSISDEFPLHINVDSARSLPGMWAEKHDFVQPNNRLVDQLKQLFGVEDSSRRLSEAARQKNNAAGGGRNLGITGGKRYSDWFNDQVRNKPTNVDDLEWRIAKLNELLNDTKRRNVQMPQHLQQKLDGYLDQRLARDTGVSQGSSGKLQQARDQAALQLDSAPYGTVATTQTDPSWSGPDSSVVDGFVKDVGKKYPNAMNFISRKYNIGSAQDLDRAEMVLDIAEKTLSKARLGGWKDEDIWDEIELDVDDQFSQR